jgi:hypothetical protein
MIRFIASNKLLCGLQTVALRGESSSMRITAPTQKAGFRVPKTVLWLIKH